LVQVCINYELSAAALAAIAYSEVARHSRRILDCRFAAARAQMQ
jgi:hypothetical protein